MKQFLKFEENGEEKSGQTVVSYSKNGEPFIKVKTENGYSIISPEQITEVRNDESDELDKWFKIIDTGIDTIEKLAERTRAKAEEQKASRFSERLKEEVKQLVELRNEIKQVIKEFTEEFGAEAEKAFEQKGIYEKVSENGGINLIEDDEEAETETKTTERVEMPEDEKPNWDHAHFLLTENYEKYKDNAVFKGLSNRMANGERSDSLYRQIWEIQNWGIEN